MTEVKIAHWADLRWSQDHSYVAITDELWDVFISSRGIRTARYRECILMRYYVNVYLTVSPAIATKHCSLRLIIDWSIYHFLEQFLHKAKLVGRPFLAHLRWWWYQRLSDNNPLPDKSVFIMFWVNLIEHLMVSHDTKEDIFIHWTIQL